MKGARKFWIMAVIFGLVATFLAYQYIEGVKTRYEPDDLITVVQAVADIPRDSVITPEQVTVKRVPAKFSHAAAASRQSQVVGKIATSNIVAGETILADKMLTDKVKAERLAYSIPSGKRAVSIPINQVSGVAGLVKPGDRVDVIGTVDVPAGEQTINSTVIVLQDVQVLAVGQRTGETKSAADGKKEAQSAKETTMTLAVTPEEMRPLVLVSERGSIRLALRSPVDEARVTLPPYQLKNLLGQ